MRSPLPMFMWRVAQPSSMGDHPPVRTALYHEHLALNANMVDFHGFELPIWYSNIKEEHLATRSGAGLFDVCLLYTSDAADD